MSSESLTSAITDRHKRTVSLAGFREIFGIDLRTLALFRIGLAALLLSDLGLRARDLTAHYTDFGIFPRDSLVGYLHPASFSLHLLNGTVWYQVALFLLAAAAALLLLVGYRTRLALVVSWLLLVSVQNRNPMILSGEDNLIVLLAFWGMFLPLGARYSIDAALNKSEPAKSNAYASVATFALLIQGMSMYFFSALLKSDQQWIPDGTAVYYALQLDYLATPFALWFRQFEGLLHGLTYYVWAVELIGPFLIFCPLFHRQLRALFQIVFITMHIGFFLCLEIGLFPFVSILMNLTFTQGWVWDRLDRLIQQRAARGIVVFYDQGCDFCLKICRILRIFLILPNIEIRPAQGDEEARKLMEAHNSWVVREAGGKYHLKWDAMLALIRVSPIGALPHRFFCLAPLRTIGGLFYEFVARHRGRFSAITARALPFRANPQGPTRLGTSAVLVLTAFVFLQNLSTLPGLAYRLPDPLVAVRQSLGLYQNWTMFAPHPEMTSPWPIIVGQLQDGTIVDVYNRRVSEPNWEKPERVSEVYANYRWRKYLSNIEDLSYESDQRDFGLNFGRYLCRQWNHDAAPGKALSTFQIFFKAEWSKPCYLPKEPKTRRVWRHNCFG